MGGVGSACVLGIEFDWRTWKWAWVVLWLVNNKGLDFLNQHTSSWMC